MLVCVQDWRVLTFDPAFVAMHRSRAEPLLIDMSGFERGTTLQLMDMDDTVVRRFPPRDGHWMLRASLNNLACISSGSERSGTLVVDLSTGKALLPCLKLAEGILPGTLLLMRTRRTVRFSQALVPQHPTGMRGPHPRRRHQMEAGAITPSNGLTVGQG
jgi:hypothetical protein